MEGAAEWKVGRVGCERFMESRLQLYGFHMVKIGLPNATLARSYKFQLFDFLLILPTTIKKYRFHLIIFKNFGIFPVTHKEMMCILFWKVGSPTTLFDFLSVNNMINKTAGGFLARASLPHLKCALRNDTGHFHLKK